MTIPPIGPSPIQPTGSFSGLRPGAIVVGVIVDILATMAAFTGLVLVLTESYARDVIEQVPEEVLDEISSTPEFLFWAFVLGSLCTALGGYVGAGRARCHYVRHGAVVGLTSLLIALINLLFSASGSTTALWYDLSSAVVIIPCGAAGGWLAERRAATQRA